MNFVIMLALMDALNLMDAADDNGKRMRYCIKFVKKSTEEKNMCIKL